LISRLHGDVSCVLVQWARVDVVARIPCGQMSTFSACAIE
jgi:hypothetical protein